MWSVWRPENLEPENMGRVPFTVLTSLKWQVRVFAPTTRIYILFGWRGHTTAASTGSVGLSAFT